MRSASRRVPGLRGVAVAVIAVLTLGLASSFAPRSVAATSDGGLAGSVSHPVTKSKRVSRVFLNNGVSRTVDSRTVHVTVDDTQNLRSLQQVGVSWSGAHVTDGIELDENSDLAQNEEYPFVLLECRGLDSNSVPAKDRLSPQTCWTQYADERYFALGNEPAWQSDLYASAAEREPIVGAPAHENSTCQAYSTHDVTQRWVPFDAPSKTYDGGPQGCAGLPPEASPLNQSSLSLPSNETFGVTGTDGKGSALFDVFTDEDHVSLGCSVTVRCSLVAIPIEGMSCDPDGANLPLSEQPTADQAATAQTNCESNGTYQPGQLLSNTETSGTPAVDGQLWWSPSNWRNRISFPLTFAQADNVCSLVSNQNPISIYGSELMTQAVTRWSPHFCLNPKLFNVKLVQTPEPEARRLLSTGGVEAAASSYGGDPPYTTPTVNAPVAVSGFGIAFQIDDANHQPVASLHLNARLLAKLLTESYPAEPFVKDADPALANNPLNITSDPEFQALNPGIPSHVVDVAATLLTLNVQSDVMTALTTYINDDPAARAWLNGKPDPWGMVVNPEYKGIKLPVSSWPLLDTFEPTDEYQIGRDDCLAVDPVPYLPLVADPQSSLFQIALDTAFTIAQPQTTCYLPSPIPGDDTGAKNVANGREPAGTRFMLSVVSLADAERYSLPLAGLETSSTVSPTTAFTSGDGMTFVAPSDASLTAAVATAKPDSATGTWPLDYPAMRTAAHSDAYPGTMIVYGSVPTTGLPSEDATDYATFLRYAAGPGQVPGDVAGDLPGGYLPMTAANGLGSLVSYTRRAADAVEAQQGAQPSLIASPSKSGGNGGKKGNGGGKGGSDGSGGSTGPSSAPPTQPISTPPSSPTSTTTAPSSKQSPPSVAPNESPAALGTTSRLSAGAVADLLPILMLVLLVSGGAAAAIRIRAGRPR